MKYLNPMFESIKTFSDIIREIESILVPDKEEFNNIFLDWNEFLENTETGRKIGAGNLSRPRFRYYKRVHLELCKKYSSDIFNGGLNSRHGIGSSISYDIGRMLNDFVKMKRKENSKYGVVDFNINEYQNFYKNYGVGGWERYGYDFVIDWTIFTDFKTGLYKADQTDEFLEVEEMVQECVERMEQYFGLKYSLHGRDPHGFQIINIYFYK